MTITKICKKCILEKNIDYFRFSFDKRKNKSYRKSMCIDCEKLYKQTEKYKNSRKQYYI